MEDDYTRIKRNRFLIILGTVFVLTVFVLVFFMIGNRSSIDAPPEEGTSTDYKNMVRIVDGEVLFKKLGGGSQYDQLASDLFYFAKNQYKQYSNINKIIGFEIISEITKQKDVVELSGKFGSVNNTIKIKVTLLKNTRINTSLLDTKTGNNIDSKLPSNSIRNKLIAKLPYKTSDFVIEYDKFEDSFMINIFDGDTSDLNKATSYLISVLGKDAFNKEKYSFIRSGGFSNDQSLVDTVPNEIGE